MKRVFSGMQASGDLHIGNYLGALKNWVHLQNNHECFYFIADLHAITLPISPADLRTSSIEVTASWLACGIDPKKSVIFSQSMVNLHGEAGWIFNCFTSTGLLNRMTQFKDKAGKDKEKASLGLYAYPVLQAADILLYKPDLVPVGEDQRQHLELTRDITLNLNRAFKESIDYDYFALPEAMISENTMRIMSLQDGLKKMSKSDPSEYSHINLKDDKEQIILKIKKAKTDSGSEITYAKDMRPEIANLLHIYSGFSDQKLEDVISMFEGKNFAKLKADLADLLIEKLYPINAEFNRILKEEEYIINILREGSERAREVASTTLKEMKSFLGFLA